MRAILILGLVMLLGACSSTPRNSSKYSYSNTYVAPTKPQYQAQTYQAPTYRAQAYSATANNSYSAQRPTQKVSTVSPQVTVSHFERLSYEDLVRFEPPLILLLLIVGAGPLQKVFLSVYVLFLA